MHVFWPRDAVKCGICYENELIKFWNLGSHPHLDADLEIFLGVFNIARELGIFAQFVPYLSAN